MGSRKSRSSNSTTNPSRPRAEIEFGDAAKPGVLEGRGSTRWKQRAFYDALKDTAPVSVGVKVHVKDQKSGESRKFQVVGSAEADPTEDKLSNESPIGSALMGHKKGDVVTIDVPRGPKKKLKITKIEA